jgi:hypothetical protein
MVLVRILAAAASGAALMYVLHPAVGRRRRALMRDQLVHAAHRTSDAVDTTSRDLTNRARGVVAELRGRLQGGEVRDRVLAERARARVGAVIGRGSAIGVNVEHGRVTLTGPVLADEVDRLLARVRAVRGVRSVENKLEVYAEAGNIPGLQGRPRPPRGGEVFELWQDDWSPAARAISGFVGLVLVLTGLRRFDALGLLLGLGGIGLLARVTANEPLTRVVSAERIRAPRGAGGV